MSEIPLRDLDTNQNLEKCRLSTTLWSQAVDALRKIKQGVDVGLKALDAQQAGRCVLCNENLGDANSSKVYKFSSPTFPINRHLSSRERLERGLTNDYVFFTVDVRVPICSDCVVRANNDQLAYDAKIKRTNRRCDALLKFRTYTIAVLALVAGAVTFVFANWYLSLLAMGAIVWLCDKVIPEPSHYFKHELTPLESLTIQGDTNEIAQTVCTFVATNSETQASIPVSNISQVGDDSFAEDACRRRYVWNAANDAGVAQIDDLVLSVSVHKYSAVQLWEGGPYWSECNVGAAKPEEYGYYFWWGDTVGYARNATDDGWVSVQDGTAFSFDSSACPTSGKSLSDLQSMGYLDAVGNLTSSHDAATAHLGDPWRMPTLAEYGQLVDNCDVIWTTLNGTDGALVSGRGDFRGRRIFLPFAGLGRNSSISGHGSSGYYSPSTFSNGKWQYFFCESWPNDGSCSCYLTYYTDGSVWCGQSVRPVRVSSFGVPSLVEGTTHLKLDCRTGARACTATEEVALCYDASWYDGGTEVRITDNGTVVTKGISGVCSWRPDASSAGLHTLKMEILSEEGEIVSAAEAKFVYTVTEVTAQQRYPWNGLVDIVVTIRGDTNEIAKTESRFVATNCATQTTVPVTGIAVAGPEVFTEGTCVRHYCWNAEAELGGVRIDDLQLMVKVQKKLSGVQLWENGPYWAECNVGATNPEKDGYYFWWGDTVGYVRNAADDGWVSSLDVTAFVFTAGNCPTYNSSNDRLQWEGYIDSTGNLVAAHDAATAHLGAPWRMPTYEEIAALIANCTAVWTNLNGVSGQLVTGKGDYASKSIFLPAAGDGNGPDLNGNGSYGDYYSSTVRSDDAEYAWNFCIEPGYFYQELNLYRYYGDPVRPIRSCLASAPTLAEGMTYVKLDCRTGTRAAAAEGEVLQYDANWYEGGSVARITDNGVVLTNGVAGSFGWNPASIALSQRTLKLEVLSDAGTVVGTETVQFVVSDFVYTVADGAVTIGNGEDAAISTDYAGDLSIPVMREGCPVTAIAASAFEKCAEITSVTIPASVETIGADAFYRCSNLVSVTFGGDEPKYVDEDAFYKVASNCTVWVTHGTAWSCAIPGTWKGLSIHYLPWCDETLAATADKADGTTFSFSTSLDLTVKAGCSIFYTLDGSEPTTNSAVYAAPLTIMTTTTVRYFVTDPSTGCWSPIGKVTLTRIATEDDTIVVAPSVADGTRFIGRQSVSLTAGAGETIWYTTDGSDPVSSATRQRYTEAIQITDNTTLKYYAVNAYGDYSAVQTVTYFKRMADGVGYEETVDGLNWRYSIVDGNAIVGSYVAIPGAITVPVELGGCPVVGLGRDAFRENVELTSITIPASITNIGYFAFRDCLRLAEVKFLGSRPHVDLGVFMGVPAYAVVSSKTGCVTAVLPTEVNGDVVSVPEGWLDEIATRHKGDTPAGYSSYEEAFVAKYGSDLTKALAKPTGKRDTQGNAMMVWQDFVAGTDPLDEEDTFQATVTLEDGVPVVRWLPELTAAEAAKRSYKTYAKTALKDGAEWTDVSALTDEARQEAGYQFFKVTVEMK